jgi:PAS domain S-box-containing protein
MNLNELSREIERMSDRTARLRSVAVAHDGPDGGSIDALEETLEELRAAREELNRLGDQLAVTQQSAEADQRRFRDLFDLAPVGYLVTDAFGTVREANDAATELLNIRSRHLIGKPLACFFPDEALPAYRAELYRLASADRLEGFETRIKPRGLPPIHVSIGATVARDLDGDTIAIRWILHNISALVQAGEQIRSLNALLEDRVLERTSELREQIRRQEELLIAAHASADPALLDLVQGLDAIVWRADADTGRYAFISRHAEDLLGHPAERWLGDPTFSTSLVHPQDREWLGMERKRLAGEEQRCETEYRMIAADGRTYWFREIVRLFQAGPADPGELRGLMINITRRKKVERQLYAAKQSLSNELADLRYLHDLLGRLSPTMEPGPLCREILGSVTEILGAETGAIYLRDLERGGWRLEAEVEWPGDLPGAGEPVSPGSTGIGPVLALEEPACFQDGQNGPGRHALPALIRDGGFRTVFSLPLPSRGGESLGSVVVLFEEAHRPAVRSTSLAENYARKAAEFVENAHLLRRLREADRRKDAALATLGHELRTPLAAVLHAAEILGLSDVSEDHEVRETLARQARHAACLVDALLEACRLRGGQAAIRRVPTDFAAVAHHAATSVRSLIDARALHLNVEFPAEPVWVEGDPDRLEQVAVNLMANAAKFTEPGGTISLAVEPGEGTVSLRVCDTGAGIRPELLPEIFNLYAQAEPSRGGMGIGLALVKSLTELHGGQVSVSSAGPGQGSEFVVCLPRAPVIEGRLPKPSVAGTDPKIRQVRIPTRVLLVEDHEDLARLLTRVLQSAGHEVKVAADGPSALDAVPSFRPQVILLDLGLPGMDGCDVARQLRMDPGMNPVRIVAMTGRGDDDAVRRAREVGCDDYLVKPVDSNRLLDALESKRIVSQGTPPCFEPTNGLQFD